jgi:hypothetical protein
MYFRSNIRLEYKNGLSPRGSGRYGSLFDGVGFLSVYMRREERGLPMH